MGKTYARVTELLKKEFEEKKVSKYTFCKQTGINPTSVERYLCGISEPNQSSLEKLAEYFGVSVSWLRGESAFENHLLDMDKIIEADGEFSLRDCRNSSSKWKKMRTQYDTETAFEIEEGMKKFPELFRSYREIPDEQKNEALEFLWKLFWKEIGSDSFKKKTELNFETFLNLLDEKE